MSQLLSQTQRQELLDSTRHWIAEAEKILARTFRLPEIHFDLSGQSAGQYRGGPHPCIRYNQEIASAQFENFCARTPAHEVAHYIMDCIHPGGGIKPHGREWQDLMHAFGLNPTRCHQYDLEQVSQRRQRRFSYHCSCREHRLSTTRHNRVQYRGVEYRCIKCGQVLVSSSGK